ncbi:MAG: hypothetical protein J6J17_04990 [Bacilli bacterium]|nr:hypothetical protein [Bacilli bacterium]
MKKFIIFIICLIICLPIIDDIFFNDKIYNYLINEYFNKNYNIVTNVNALKPNEYVYTEYSSFVKSTDNFYPKNKNELLNIYYTALNNDYNEFSYYCDSKYQNCFNDIEDLSKDLKTFSYLNQLVHPFNSFKTIESNYINKRVDVKIEKKYSNNDIKKINDELNDIINKLNINAYSNINDKIKLFHDYLASINKYDKNKENSTSTYNSDSAVGALFEGYAVCSGYTDAMAIFLNMLNLENVRVITDKHAWNAVKIDDIWYHIDLTWDDPITNTNEDIIQHDYFLISTDELLSKNDGEHNFSTIIYDFIK